jgi:hypothetical protein
VINYEKVRILKFLVCFLIVNIGLCLPSCVFVPLTPGICVISVSDHLLPALLMSASVLCFCNNNNNNNNNGNNDNVDGDNYNLLSIRVIKN